MIITVPVDDCVAEKALFAVLQVASDATTTRLVLRMRQAKSNKTAGPEKQFGDHTHTLHGRKMAERGSQ
jgi:hypothetical protein